MSGYVALPPPLPGPLSLATVVIIATLVDLAWIIVISKPALRVRYNLGEAEGSPTLEEVLKPSLTAVIPRRPQQAGLSPGSRRAVKRRYTRMRPGA